MQLFDNINNLVNDDLKLKVQKNSKVCIVACFSIYDTLLNRVMK